MGEEEVQLFQEESMHTTNEDGLYENHEGGRIVFVHDFLFFSKTKVNMEQNDSSSQLQSERGITYRK